MKTPAIALALAVLIPATASAMPGQTAAQLAAWGKHNHALRGFRASVDDETGAREFVATVIVDGMSGHFHAEPVHGRVPREYLTIEGVSDTWQLADHERVMRDAIGAIYGAAYADDFANAKRNRPRQAVTIWAGKRLVYAAFGSALYVFGVSELQAVTQNALYCDAIDCTG